MKNCRQTNVCSGLPAGAHLGVRWDAGMLAQNVCMYVCVCMWDMGYTNWDAGMLAHTYIRTYTDAGMLAQNISNYIEVTEDTFNIKLI